jgi:hypothetical protein
VPFFCQSSAFHPIINELNAARHREDTAEQKLAKLASIGKL